MRALLLVSIVIMLAAVSAPGILSRYLEQRGGGRASAAAVEENATDAAAPAPARRSAAGQVEFSADGDGHFYVEADINFQPVRLMVDTGATVLALRQSDAEAAGIRLVAADFRHPVSTANGVAHAAETELDQVSVQGIEVSGVRALILPDDRLAVNLLGGTFLSRLARYEVKDGVLIFEN
jgi:aspartyl protease family protein